MKIRTLENEDGQVESFDVEFPDGITANYPASTIGTASDIAYNEDEFQAVGWNASNELIIRSWEDPESDTLRRRVKVGSSGITSN